MTALKTGILACVIGVSTSSALAAPLNLTLGRPDITSNFILVTYNATSDTLTATGTALTIDLNNVPPPDFSIANGTFSLTATINSAGAITGGTLTIGGTIAGLGAGSPLLTANLANFGFSSSPVTQIFEFTGATTGGSLASSFGPSIGVIMTLGGGFQGTFNSNFQNSGFGSSDTALIPTPGAGAMALAAGALAMRRRRR